MSSVHLLCADACPEVLPVAAADPAIMSDVRVLAQLLKLEWHSMPNVDYFAPNSHQSELQPYMRRVVTTWMLEVNYSPPPPQFKCKFLQIRENVNFDWLIGLPR